MATTGRPASSQKTLWGQFDGDGLLEFSDESAHLCGTSVISYLTARPHRDVIVAGQQQLTREWWENGARHHDLYSSDVVWEEAAQGDQAAAAKRLGFLENLPEIPVTEATIELAELLLQAGALPAVAYADALHVTVCATNEMDILVTWNCKHIANVTMLT